MRSHAISPLASKCLPEDNSRKLKEFHQTMGKYRATYLARRPFLGGLIPHCQQNLCAVVCRRRQLSQLSVSYIWPIFYRWSAESSCIQKDLRRNLGLLPAVLCGRLGLGFLRSWCYFYFGFTTFLLACETKRVELIASLSLYQRITFLNMRHHAQAVPSVHVHVCACVQNEAMRRYDTTSKKWLALLRVFSFPCSAN